MSIAKRLKQLRGLDTQKKFAAKLGVSSQAIINYEKYGRIPSERIISLICARFEVSRDWLVNGNNLPDAINTPSQSPCASLKPLTRQRFFEPEISQHIENTDSKLEITSDTSEVGRLQNENIVLNREIISVYRDKDCLQQTLINTTRENADLRVELERRKAQLRELERENADLRKAMKPTRLSGLDGQSVA